MMDPSAAKARASVLLVDDEAPLRRALERYLNRVGHDVCVAGSVQEGRTVLSRSGVDVAFVDFRLPDGNGAELIRWAKANNRAQSIYCMTGHASCRNTVEAMQAGSLDVLEKPFEVTVLADLVAGQLAAHGPLSGPQLGRWRVRYAGDIVGQSPELIEALDTIRSIADTDCTVLITGESGTGKELVARALHASSTRADGPFVPVNCAAIPDTMLEAELFGHTRGAFTGAVASRTGRLAAAQGGTLFLDEIGDMPLAAQAKLLRVLQDHTILPVGADEPVELDIRVIAATNQDLEAMVADGKFRADLYYRLNVVPVELPPLRARGEDVILLAEQFLRVANERNGRDVLGFDAAARDALLGYEWPGNVRELAHMVERAVLIKRQGRLTASDLRLRPRARTNPGPGQDLGDLDLKRSLDQVERQLITEALTRTDGNRTEAAALLGVNRTTLVEKIRKHNA